MTDLNQNYQYAYCIGDLCLTPINEDKNVNSLKYLSKLCGLNIILDIQGK